MADLKAIYDINYAGGIDSKGQVKELWGNDALTNAIKIWLSLSQGEILRRPTDGGILIKQLTKPMSPARLGIIQNEIYSGLTQFFAPSLTSVDVTVEADYIQRRWLINITAYCDAIKDSVDFNMTVRNLV